MNLYSPRIRNSLDYHNAKNFKLPYSSSEDPLRYSSISTHEFVQAKKIPSILDIRNFKKNKKRKVIQKLPGKRSLKTHDIFEVGDQADLVHSLQKRRVPLLSFENLVGRDTEEDELFNVTPVLSKRVHYTAPATPRPRKRRIKDKGVLKSLATAKKSLKVKKKKKRRKKAMNLRGTKGAERDTKIAHLDIMKHKEGLRTPHQTVEDLEEIERTVSSKNNQKMVQKQLKRRGDLNQPFKTKINKRSQKVSSGKEDPFDFKTLKVPSEIPHYTQKNSLPGSRRTSLKPQTKYRDHFDQEYKDIKNSRTERWFFSTSFVVEEMEQDHIIDRRGQRESKRDHSFIDGERLFGRFDLPRLHGGPM